MIPFWADGQLAAGALGRAWLQQASAPLRLALEGRAGWEFGAALVTAPLLRRAPRGDGHPVLVLPLMFGSDLATAPLRSYLAGQGYAAYPWGLGVNLGPREGVFEQCLTRVLELQRRHGRRVSLVGWSLGGLYARELAKEIPEAVRCVITLGTPLTGVPEPTLAWRWYGMLTGERIGLPERSGPLKTPPPVGTSSIFSRSDGIVPWRHSLTQEGPLSENIAVESSHLGLGVHPLVLYLIADRLVQAEGAWRPFKPRNLQACLFPDAPRAVPTPRPASLASRKPARHPVDERDIRREIDRADRAR